MREEVGERGGVLAKGKKKKREREREKETRRERERKSRGEKGRNVQERIKDKDIIDRWRCD